MLIFLIIRLVLILLVIFTLGVFYLMAQNKRIVLSICAGFVVVGFLLYTAAYLSFGEGLANILFAALHGIFSTARMLALNDDHGILTSMQGTQWLTENIWLQIIFWLSHVSALMLIQAALISLFGRKFIDNFRMCFGFHKEVYVIKGSDKNALLLGENISTHDASRKHSDVKRLVIFLIEEDDDEKKTYEKASHFGGIVKVLDRKNNFEFYMKKARLGKWSGRNKKYNVILMPNSTSISDDAHLVVEYAKGKNVKPERLDIFAFTLSEWERERIETTSQAKEGENRKYPYTFHIINEVDLLVRLMLENHPPYECVGLGLKNGVATRDFTVLIIGFGAVGQNALLRLIMNGQFVGSRMHAIIIDRDIEHLHEHFMHCHPSLNLCCDMDFRSINVRDEVFFKLLRENHEVDYIVAAINDDELNKQTAMDIRLHYERNNIALPFIAVLEGNRCLHEVKQDREIFVCGHQEETYKESIIIREKTDLMAKTISDTYKEIYGGNSWYEHDWFSQESNRASADFIPAMLKLAQLKKDDVINKDVLTEDSELAEILAQTEHLRWMAFHAAMGYRPISIEEMRQRFKYNGNKNPLEYSRRCSEKRLHVCLASWDELDGISAAYRELERRAGKEPKRDFKENDRDIIKYIPKFIRAAKGGE